MNGSVSLRVNALWSTLVWLAAFIYCLDHVCVNSDWRGVNGLLIHRTLIGYKPKVEYEYLYTGPHRSSRDI